MKVNSGHIQTVDTHTTDSGHTGTGQQREGIHCVLVRLCVYESEQWTYTDRGHTTLTVDTQELASRVIALTACYLGSVCVKVNSGHIQTVDTHH